MRAGGGGKERTDGGRGKGGGPKKTTAYSGWGLGARASCNAPEPSPVATVAITASQPAIASYLVIVDKNSQQINIHHHLIRLARHPSPTNQENFITPGTDTPESDALPNLALTVKTSHQRS